MQGTFIVTEADEGAAVLRDVESGQVYTLAANPGVEAEDVVEATLEPDEMDVTYTASIEERHEIPVTVLDGPPAEEAVAAGDECAEGDLTTVEDGDDVLDVIPVLESLSVTAAHEAAGGVATVERAARLGATRVQVREGSGVVVVRYRDAEAETTAETGGTGR